MKPLSSSHATMLAMPMHVAGRDRKRVRRDEFARRHALQRGVDRREQHRRLVAALDARKPRQRGHALRHHRRHWATPGRKAGNPRPGIPSSRISGPKNASARDSAAMRWPSRQITASEIAGASRPRRNGAREIGQHQTFGAVGDLRQRERLCRPAAMRREISPSPSFIAAPSRWKSRRRRNSAVSISAGAACAPFTQAKIC